MVKVKHLKKKRKTESASKGEKSIARNSSNSQANSEETSDTIFIRNLSFDTEEDNLQEFIEENFGPTVYCLICRDKETDESKGTAFVKFKDPEDTSKCLTEFKDRELQTKFHLDGRNLIVLPALSRDQVHEVKQKASRKDKRNLSLAREGHIHPNSDEFNELSKIDIEKRKVLDARKRELLKNLHNFVSDTRLCIHNLPASVDDHRLRQIFMNNIKDEFPSAKIVECRVMRNKKGGGQLGTSKGFGFVAFSKHEHALAALRKLNNNSMIFTKDKRPIVEFSIENLVALNKKKTRLVNSQRKNQEKQSKQHGEVLEKDIKDKKKSKLKAVKKIKTNKLKYKPTS